MTVIKMDQNFKQMFNLEEGWFATVPLNNWDGIPEEDFRIYIGETCAAGKVTRELIQKLMELA